MSPPLRPAARRPGWSWLFVSGAALLLAGLPVAAAQPGADVAATQALASVPASVPVPVPVESFFDWPESECDWR